MMIWDNLDSRARRLGILDTKLAQGAAMFLVLVIVKLVPEILTVNIWWFVFLSFVCALRPILIFFGPDPENR